MASHLPDVRTPMTNSEGPKAADVKPTFEEIVSLCRSDLEVLFNPQYLFEVDAGSPDKILIYAHLMYEHLERMEKILLAKVLPPGSA
jgi:hypothetical protein